MMVETIFKFSIEIAKIILKLKKPINNRLFKTISQFQPDRDHRNDRRVGDAIDHLRYSQYDHHAALPHVRNLHHGYGHHSHEHDYTLPDFAHLHLTRVHHSDHHVYGANDHHANNLHDRYA